MELGLFNFFYSYYSYESSFHGITDFLDVVCQENLELTFFLTDVSISSMLSSMSAIISSISYILLVMLLSSVPVYFPGLSISRVVLVCVFFIVSI